MPGQCNTAPLVEWRSVVGFEGLYEVSSDGQIASLRFRNGRTTFARRRILKATVQGTYLRVSLSAQNVATPCAIHVAVAEAFLGPRPSAQHVVCHADGNSLNNRLENLRWDTYQGNEADKRRHGRMLIGARNHATKITAEIAQGIRERHASGTPLHVLGRAVGLSTSTLTDLVRGHIWREAGGPIRNTRSMQGEQNNKARLTVEAVRAIRVARATGVSSVALARQYGVSKQAILALEHRRTWKHVD